MITNDDINLIKELLPFWDNLSESQKNMIISASMPFTVNKGHTIHRGDDDCIGVLLIKSGSIRKYIVSDEGREITLYRLNEGEISILSASCVIPPINFDVCIDAESHCELIQINSKVFSELSGENIYVESFTYKLISERFSEVMWTMHELLFTSFDKRLTSFLIDETLKNNNDIINMTQLEISKYLGSSREIVSRTLKLFSNYGYVQVSRGGIKILNKDKLRSLLQ